MSILYMYMCPSRQSDLIILNGLTLNHHALKYTHTITHTHTEKEKETLSNDLQGETWEFDTCREDDREAEHTPSEAEKEKLGRKS